MLIIKGALGSSMRRRRRLRVAIPSPGRWRSPLVLLLLLLALYIIQTSRPELFDHIGGDLRNDIGG